MANGVIPPELASSAGLLYVVGKGWSWKEGSDSEQISIERCPFCKHDGWHLYMNVKGKKDGLWMCQRCGKTGNLRSMQEDMGDRIEGVQSRGDWAKGEKKVEALPDVAAAHQLLLEDSDALDYLMNTRGYSEEVIKKQKLGILAENFFRQAGNVKALVIPHLVNGNCVWAKYRTLPPSPKDFDAPTGWDASLYNSEVMKPGMNELIFVEGEGDVLTLMSQGINNVVGVPGANMNKAEWVTTLDEVAPDKIFILYDSDRVGQKGAQKLAARIGIERCLKVVLPEFDIEDEEGNKRKGKDVNEWFRAGGTVEVFESLKKDAKLFDVTGVSNTGDALSELELFLEGKESLQPTYDTPWPSLSRKVGFEDGDVIDVVAKEKVGKTTFGLNLIDYEVERYKEPGIIICLEMTQQRLARKWVAMVTRTDDSPAVDHEDAVKKLAAMKLAVPLARKMAAQREADLYFAYPTVAAPEDVYELIRQCVRRYGVKWVMFDNLQLLCDTTLKNPNHRTIHLSQISKSFAKLAKDLGIKLIRIVQPKRVRDGEIVGTDDVDGSSQIAKDCDCMITLHRPMKAGITQEAFENVGYFETEASLEPRMLVNVGLSRYSGGGATTLDFDGARSVVREFDPVKKTEMAPKVDGHTVPMEPKHDTANSGI